MGIEETTEREPDANDILAQTFPARKESTLNLFAVSTFEQFNDDVEGVHDDIHVEVGGDMSSIWTSAFDPIFWLHHCQVDRLIAMYQATHPGTYVVPESRSPTFSLSAPGTDDLFTPLGPFRHADGNEWSSDEIKTAESIFTYGYAYPEVPNGMSGDALRTFTTERVNQLYGVNTQDTSFEGEDSGVPESEYPEDAPFNTLCPTIQDANISPLQPLLLAANGAQTSRSTARSCLARTESSSMWALTTRATRNGAAASTTWLALRPSLQAPSAWTPRIGISISPYL